MSSNPITMVCVWLPEEHSDRGSVADLVIAARSNGLKISGVLTRHRAHPYPSFTFYEERGEVILHIRPDDYRLVRIWMEDDHPKSFGPMATDPR